MITIVSKFTGTIGQVINDMPLCDEYVQEKELIELLIENPLDIQKEDLPLGFIFGKFIDHNGARCNENIEYINRSWITFDIDNSRKQGQILSIEDFKIMFKDYEYYLYTTGSHLKDGETEKYRAFIPSNLIEFDVRSDIERKIYKQYMVAKFPFVDHTSFEINRLFYLPSKTDDNYIAFHNTGVQYTMDHKSWNIYKSREVMNNKIMEQANAIKRKIRESQPNYNHDKFKEAVLKNLEKKMWKRIDEGSTYQFAVKFVAGCRKCKDADIDNFEIEEALRKTPLCIKDIKHLIKGLR